MAYKYLGGGILPGVPARDLSDEDVASLDADVKALLKEHMTHPDGVRVFDEVKPPAAKKGD